MTDNLKLTPTFTDLHVVGQHEPLSGVAFSEPHTLPGVWGYANIPIVESPPIVPEVKPYRKIAIIGTAPSSRDLAPFNDPSWEIWACSPGNKEVLPRVTRWYEIHINLLWKENAHYGEPYLAWLNEQAAAGKFEVWMQDQRFVPLAKRFPKPELVKEFGEFFFTSTFAWLMAAAIAEGVQEVALYGVDMASRDEYILQRPGGHYFIQKCKERGVKVVIPPESDLAQPPGLYGYSENTPFLRKVLVREQELKSRIAPMEQQVTAMTQQILYLKGALEDIDYFKSIWASAQAEIEA